MRRRRRALTCVSSVTDTKIFCRARRLLFTLPQSSDCLKRAGVRLITTIEALSEACQTAAATMISLL
jgi:hypothetical protein